MTEKQISKRELLKKAAYVAPAILTLNAVPSFAFNGSGLTEKRGKQRERQQRRRQRVGSSTSGKSPGK